MALYRYDPATKAVTRLHFPEKLSFIHPEPGYAASLESVVFSSNAKRMAIVVEGVKKSERENEPDHSRRACYSAEIEASGARLIHQTEPDAGKLYPAWSHNGRRLVILDSSGNAPSLFVYNYDGTGKRMAPLPTEQAEPSATH